MLTEYPHYKTLDGKQILQMRMDGFTFSRLQPYINWENLRSEFFTRIVIQEHSINAVAIVTQALEQITLKRAPIILDIDVCRLQPNGIDEEEAWKTLDQLRHFKNDIFFKSVTDKLMEIYK